MNHYERTLLECAEHEHNQMMSSIGIAVAVRRPGRTARRALAHSHKVVGRGGRVASTNRSSGQRAEWIR